MLQVYKQFKDITLSGVYMGGRGASILGILAILKIINSHK